MEKIVLSNEEFEEVVKIRRKLHRIPELGMDLKKTSDLVCEELDQSGISYTRYGDSGIIAEIKGTLKESDDVIMLRGDMDALPVKEKTGLDFASENENMHACGHDLHTAMLIGTAKKLFSIKDSFAGTIRFLFQASEEPGLGAKFLYEKGAMKDVKMGMGIHMDPLRPTGEISAIAGPDWASCDRFKIKVIGKGGHGAMPHKCIDATIAAAAIVMNMQSIVSRNTDPKKPLVITIGALHSGTAFNIISGEAVLEGTCRCFDKDVYESLPSMVRSMAVNTAKTYGCETEFEFVRLIQPLINNAEACSLLKKTCEEAGIPFADRQSEMIAEDFAVYANAAPCIFAHLGAGGCFPLHNPEIIFEEESMKNGILAEVNFALNCLKK